MIGFLEEMKRKGFWVGFNILIDICNILVSFAIMTLFKPTDFVSYFRSHYYFFISLVVLWLLLSFISGKYQKRGKVRLSKYVIEVTKTNLMSFGITIVIMFALQVFSYSRVIVFGTFLLSSFFEIFFIYFYYVLKKPLVQDSVEDDLYKFMHPQSEYELVDAMLNERDEGESVCNVNPDLLKRIKGEVGEEASEEIAKMIGHKSLGPEPKISVLSTSNPFNVTTLVGSDYDYLINLRRLNDIGDIDRFFDAVNSKLRPGGYFLCCVFTKNQRKEKMLEKYPPFLNVIIYTFDFLINRVLPKLPGTNYLYKVMKGNKNKIISRAETLGRVCRAGFSISEEVFRGEYLFVESVKARAPLVIKNHQSSPIIVLERVGYQGKVIGVYKLRTMYPYSAYIQNYVYMHNSIQEGGKFKNDFRVTTWGAICRKIWLDEFPMFINFFKGELKLVGVRPLSKQYLSLYDEEIRQRRIKYKPGLLPPFYVDIPRNLKEIQESEIRYLDLYDKHPWKTDIQYFFKAVCNIIFRKARSK